MHIYIAATFDTKSEEAIYLQQCLKNQGLPVLTVDLSTSKQTLTNASFSADYVASFHPKGSKAVFTNDRGQSIAAMTEAFIQFISHQTMDIGAILGIGGSGGTALITRAMQTLPIGLPKLMVSTLASGNVASYVGMTDITMMHSVTDIAGLNRVSKPILANAAGMIAGAFRAATQFQDSEDQRQAIGITMFGVTTPCVQHLTQNLKQTYDCVTFHATGTGGQAMEKLLDDRLLTATIDLTTTEVADFLFGGILPCTADRFGAIARSQCPAVVSLGALDMVNFGSIDSVPKHYQHRLLYEHNSQITLMRTSVEENAEIGQWIANRLNQCDAPIRILIPEGGLSALDAPGQPFFDKNADDALFDSLTEHLEQTKSRQLIRTPHHINSPEFAAEVMAHFHQLAPLM